MFSGMSRLLYTMIVEFIIAHYHEGKIKRCTFHTNNPPHGLICQVVNVMF